MDHQVELANHHLRDAIRADLLEAGFEEFEITGDVINSYMPARLDVEIANQEAIQRMYMDRAAAVPDSTARSMLLTFTQLRQVKIDNLRFLKTDRYG